jgi:hypothetical protein
MRNDTKKARDILVKNGYTCVMCRENEEFHSALRGVKPLIDFLESNTDFNGFSAADKTVGLGAAHLYLLLGVKSVWAKVISQGAKEILEKNGVEVSFEEEVPYIINRRGDGRCPIEAAVNGIACPSEALRVIKETLSRL